MMMKNNKVLYCPDGVQFSSIPYIIGYLNCSFTSNLREAKKFDTILFSWTHFLQEIDWVKEITDQEIIIGGSYVKYLTAKNQLPIYSNVKFISEDIDFPEYTETKVTPNFAIQLEDNPYMDSLIVYSGRGCNWRKCSFCTVVKEEKYMQFSPAYVAKIILQVNFFGKLAGLSTLTHTVDYLMQVEEFLPQGKRYWCSVRADEKGWSKLKNLQAVFIGSEYFSDSVLSRIEKGVTTNQIISSIIEILGLGIDVHSNIIEDLYETEQEQKEHHKNKLFLLQYITPPQYGWGKLFLYSNRLTKRGSRLKENINEHT